MSPRAVTSVSAVYWQTGREAYDGKVEWRRALSSHRRSVIERPRKKDRPLGGYCASWEPTWNGREAQVG